MHAAMDRNLTGTMNVCRAVAPGMMEPPEGRIVNVASAAGLHATTVGPIYAVATAAIIHYPRSLAAHPRPSACLLLDPRRPGQDEGGLAVSRAFSAVWRLPSAILHCPLLGYV